MRDEKLLFTDEGFDRLDFDDVRPTYTPEQIEAAKAALATLKAEKEARRQEFLAGMKGQMDSLGERGYLRVASGQIPCPSCANQGQVSFEDERFFCWCVKPKGWINLTKALVPRRYFPQMVLLAHIKPSEKSIASIEFQKRVIDAIRANPKGSFAFFGPAGCGKTALSMTLLSKAAQQEADAGRTNSKYGVYQSAHIFRCSASAIVDQHHAYITASDDDDEVEIPDITEYRIRNTATPHVFIAEFEKIGNLTEFRYKTLFTLVDACYETAGVQFVMDSNLTPAQFEEHFTDKIMRRVAEMCCVVDYFTESISEPTGKS